jgi:hypothetical protein
MSNTKDRIKIELDILSEYNKQYNRQAKKERLLLGSGARHEYDIFERGYVIGGVTTSPWTNKTAKCTQNTGGKDRASAELLWLTLWEGRENRIIIFSDKEMAEKLYKIWSGCHFPNRIEFIHYSIKENKFDKIGTL